MFHSTPEPVVILLEWNPDIELVTVRDDGIIAILPLHSIASLLCSVATHRGSSWLAHSLSDCHINIDLGGALVHNRSRSRGAVPNINFLGHNLVFQSTVFPGDVFAVLISSPDLLSLLIDHPLGVTLLLGYGPTHWHLLYLCDDLLLTADGAQLLGKVLVLQGIISDQFGGWYILTFWVCVYLTLRYWNSNTDFF